MRAAAPAARPRAVRGGAPGEQRDLAEVGAGSSWSTTISWPSTTLLTTSVAVEQHPHLVRAVVVGEEQLAGASASSSAWASRQVELLGLESRSSSERASASRSPASGSGLAR
jgi:hypothetical protein